MEKRYRHYRRALLGYKRIYINGGTRSYCKTTKKWVCNPAILIEDKSKSMIVRDLFKLYLEGHSTITIPEIIKAKYNFKIMSGAVYDRLKQEFYIGYDHGKLHGFPALIDEETFHKVQEMLKNKRTSLKTKVRKNKLGIKIQCRLCGYALRYNGEGFLRCIVKKNHSNAVINLKKIVLDRYIQKAISHLNFKEEPETYYHIFKNLYFDGQRLTHELHDEFISPKTIADPVVDYCSESRSFNEILEFTGMELSQLQERITDLELNGKIIEQSGYYKAL